MNFSALLSTLFRNTFKILVITFKNLSAGDAYKSLFSVIHFPSYRDVLILILEVRSYLYTCGSQS